MEKDYIITFQNTNYAMKAERALLDVSLCVVVLPLPSQISAGCGLCLKISQHEIDSALSALAGPSVGEICVYSRTPDNNRHIYTELGESLDVE
jgi:hypothetical protein